MNVSVSGVVSSQLQPLLSSGISSIEPESKASWLSNESNAFFLVLYNYYY